VKDEILTVEKALERLGNASQFGYDCSFTWEESVYVKNWLQAYQKAGLLISAKTKDMAERMGKQYKKGYRDGWNDARGEA
jgi:hypothetical protein